MTNINPNTPIANKIAKPFIYSVVPLKIEFTLNLDMHLISI